MAKLSEDGEFQSNLVSCRYRGNYILSNPSTIDYVDVSPKQIVSAAASLIPFLENDDANRALMGSNMQRQAVPVLYPEAPLVGTGMEQIIAKDSETCVVARRDGVVIKVDSVEIIVKSTEDIDIEGEEEGAESLIDIYKLIKFKSL